MPKIDFYILPEPNLANCLLFVCRLIEKAFKQKHRIYIHTQQQTQAHQLDEMLWTYRDDSFLPHNIFGEGPEPAPPIQIGTQVTPTHHHDILINLSSEVPSFHHQFARILELILSDPAAQEAGRERYRFYRSHGFEINTHKLSTLDN